jgi:hypothetical protein
MRGYRGGIWAVSAGAALVLAACGHFSAKHAVGVIPPHCDNGGFKATAELVFSRVSDDGSDGVSEADFSKFLDAEVSPRFPEGLTVVDAEGRWTPPAGSMIREPAKMVMIVLPGRSDDGKKLEAVRVAYKTKYHQQSVLLMTHGDCVSF